MYKRTHIISHLSIDIFYVSNKMIEIPHTNLNEIKTRTSMNSRKT